MRQVVRRETLLALGSLVGFTIFFSVTLSSYIYHGAQLNLWSFSMVHMAGYCFFFIMPVELLIPFILRANPPLVLLWSLSMLTAMIPLMFDYAVGYLVPSAWVIDFVGRRRYARLSRILAAYGKYVVFLFGALPLSEPLLMLVAGIVKFRFREAMLYSFLGLAVKYAVLIWLARAGISLWW